MPRRKIVFTTGVHKHRPIIYLYKISERQISNLIIVPKQQSIDIGLMGITNNKLYKKSSDLSHLLCRGRQPNVYMLHNYQPQARTQKTFD